MRLRFREEHAFLRLSFTCPPYPIVPVTLTASSGKSVSTYALVDTGADYTIFHAAWARKIGLRLKAGRKSSMGGIDPSSRLICYYHRIRLMVGYKNTVRCDVAFSEEIDNDLDDQLIGRDVVFDRMRFAFRQRIGKFYIGDVP